MATIDERVVSMSFENNKFESGVSGTLSSLDKLKKALNFKDAGKGLEGINAAAQKTDLSHISRGVDALKSKFGALRLVAIATLAGIATKAIGVGTNFLKQFTFAPLIDGLHEYETQINSVQTILGNTAAAGTTLQDVNKALSQLNTYADKTIYNFSEMTRNIGTFTAAGVDLKTSVASIKGIANIAALSGSNAQQASTAMYQLSQAISSGKVALQDWKSVENASMGSATFKRALAETAVHMGTLSKNAVKMEGPMKNVTIAGQSFRDSISSKPGQKSWLTSDVLTTTLKHLSGDMTDAQLAAEGYSKAQIKSIQNTAKLALNAATQVKTFSQLLDTTKEQVGSGWAQTWQIIFGDFGEAKKLFTGLSNAIGGFVGASANARNKVLKDWKDLGGRTLLIDSLKRAFKALVAVISPIKDAFRDIFPKKTGKDLYDLTKRFNDFTKTLKPSPETVENLRRTFRGFFAVLDIGKQIVGGIFSVIGRFFGALGKGSGGFLNLTGNVGDFLVSLDKTLKKSGAITKFFERLGDIIAAPIHFLTNFSQAITAAFSGTALAGQSLTPIQRVITTITDAWDRFLDSVGNSQGIVQTAADGIKDIFGSLGDFIAGAVGNMSLDSIFHVLEVGLLAGIAVLVKKAFSGDLANALSGGLIKGLVDTLESFGGLSKSVSGTFGALTGSIKTMQNNVKSDTLKNIAISIALLAASLVGLSLVDPDRLSNALSTMTIAFAELLGAMAILDKIGKSGGFLKMPVIAASMIMLAGAVDLLALAVAGLSRLSWEELAKGLGAVSVLLASISVAAGPLGKNSAGMIRAGAGITIIAVAMNILAKAVQSFGGMDMPTLAKGIGGIAVALAGIGAAARLFPPGMVSIGVGLVAVGAGLKLIAGSVEKLGNMKMATLAKGIGAIAIALGGIGLAMNLMPGPSMVITAAGLLLVSTALLGISKAVKSLGGMSVDEIAKGLGALAGSLTLLTLALYAMSGTFAGAAALTVAAGALALLAPALKSLGDQSWGQIIKGLVALAAAFALLGIAGVALAPVAPAILALGGALIAVGAGLALAGAGVALIGIGLSSIAIAGPAAVKILVDALVQLVLAIPKFVEGLVKGLEQLITSLAKSAPKFVQGVGKILSAMAQAVVVATPQLAKAFSAIVGLVLKVLQDESPRIIEAGFQLLKSLLKGISTHISEVVKMVTTIVGKFMAAVASNLGKIVNGGVNILVALLRGIGNSLSKIVTTVGSIISKFLSAIANNLGKIATAGLSILTKLLSAITNNLSRVINMGTTIIVRLVKGIGDAGPKIIAAAVTAITKFVHAISKGAVRLADEGAKAIINFLNGVADVIEKREPEILAAGARIGKALVQGVINGIGSLAGALKQKIEDAVTAPVSWAKRKLGIKSPSTVFAEIGGFMILGLAQGLSDHSPAVTAAIAMGTSVISAVENTFEIASPSKVMQRLGSYVGQGFQEGLLSSTDKIRDTLSTLRTKLENEISTARRTIEQENEKLRKLKGAKKQDKEAIAEVNKALKEQEKNLSVATYMHTQLTKKLQDEKKELLGLAKDYAQVAAKLEDARRALEDAKKVREDAIAGFTDKYSALPDISMVDADGNPISPADQLQMYKDALQHQADAVAAYKNTLDQLRALGLDDATYKKLLEEGTADQGFADQLLAGGKTAVDSLNVLDKQLYDVSNSLAVNAGNNLYDAGVKAAEGLVKSLEDQKSKVYKAMEDIATAMIKAIKKKLKIKSPSQVFAELGKYSAKGMAEGLSGSSGIVANAVAGMADDAVTAMKKSLSGISDAVTEHIDPNPTITPVLDLSQVQNGSKSLESMLNTVPISAAASFGQASSISAAQEAVELLKEALAEQPPIKFEQNNYSPEPLSSIEIYRQTKNQLAQARPVLAS